MTEFTYRGYKCCYYIYEDEVRGGRKSGTDTF